MLYPDPSSDADLSGRVARGTLAALLVFMPLAFGAVHAWAEFAVLAASAVLLLCVCWRRWKHRETGSSSWTPAYLPLLGFVLLALLQLLPMPLGLIAWLSPRAAEFYAPLRGESAGFFTLSLYPHGTWYDLQVVLSASAVFLAVIHFVRRSSQVGRLLLTLSVVGVALAVLAILQDAFGNGRIYWVGPSEAQANSGTFACHNHFAQHMTLSVMAMLGYGMLRLRQVLGHRWYQSDRLTQVLGRRELRAVPWIAAAAVVGLVAIALSTSRMGIGSSLLGLLVLVLLLRRKGSSRAALPLLVGLVALAGVLALGADAILDRFEADTLSSAAVARWKKVAAILPAMGHFAAVGSGLGTFGVLYPAYCVNDVPLQAMYAENEYAQLLMEMGLGGFACISAFCLLILRSAARAIRGHHPLQAASVPLAAGLLAVAIHSWTDFGQHLLANACLSATFSGLLVVMGQKARETRRQGDTEMRRGREGERGSAGESIPSSPHPLIPSSSANHRHLANALVGLLLVLVVIRLPAAFTRVLAEGYDDAAQALAARLEAAGWRAEAADYERLVVWSERAVRFAPGDAFYRYRLGLFRWRAAVRGRTAEELGDVTPPELLLAAHQIVGEMITASKRSPTFGSLQCWRGQLELWVLGLPEGADRIEQGIQRAKNDPIAWSAAGKLAAAEGNAELAAERFRRAVALKGHVLEEAVQALAGIARRPDLVLMLLKDRPEQLSRAAYLLDDWGFEGEAEEAMAAALAAFRARLSDPALSASAVAALAEAAEEQAPAEAISLYRRALAKEYRRIPWRLSLVRLLIEQDQLTQAQLELQTLNHLGADPRLTDPLAQAIRLKRKSAATQPAGQQAPARP